MDNYPSYIVIAVKLCIPLFTVRPIIYPAMTAQIAEGLTPEQLTFFNENGYLLIPDALSQETVKQLLEDTNKMLNNFSLDDHPMTKFSTGGDDGADHVGDSYFLESGDKVRFFFEEGMQSVRCLRQMR